MISFAPSEVTLDSVKHQLALTEAADLASGVAYILHEDISASMMLTMGMDFEIQKCVHLNPSTKWYYLCLLYFLLDVA